jgi:CRP-like cAMP-binding protein
MLRRTYIRPAKNLIGSHGEREGEIGVPACGSQLDAGGRGEPFAGTGVSPINCREVNMEMIRHYHPGEIIIKEGEDPDGFYILQSGELDIIKKGDKIANITEENIIFGELGSILKEPRTCSVVAKTSSYVIHVPKEMDDIIMKYPEIAKKIIYVLAKRLVETTEILSKLRGQKEEDIH